MRTADQAIIAQAPFICERCSGTGTVWFDAYGQLNGRLIPCPLCTGYGLIWPDGSDGLREKVAEVKALRCLVGDCHLRPGHGGQHQDVFTPRQNKGGRRAG